MSKLGYSRLETDAEMIARLDLHKHWAWTSESIDDIAVLRGQPRKIIWITE